MKRILISLFCCLGYLVLFIMAPPSSRATPFSFEADGTVIDQAGRKVAPGTTFSHIISLYGAHTENLFALGLDKEIIGVTLHETYPEIAKTKKTFTYHDDAEKFLVDFPDLVLIRPMIERGYPALIERLEKSGITVLSLQPGSVEELFVYWQILGRLTGREQQANELVEQFKKALGLYEQMTAAITTKKKVYFEAIHGRMRTFSPGSMAIFSLEHAGGINLASDAVPRRSTNIADYGKERILAKGPEIDVFLAQQGVMNGVTVDMIKKESGFNVIKAVQENQVYLINEQLVSRPSFRLLQGIFTIGGILYPDIFTREAAGMFKQQVPGFQLEN